MSIEKNSSEPFKYKWCDAVMSAHGPTNGYTRCFLIVMARHCRRDRDRFFVSQAQLSRETRLSERTVHTRISDAIREGWLERLERGRAIGRGESMASTYRLRLPEGFAGRKVHQHAKFAGRTNGQPANRADQPANSRSPTCKVCSTDGTSIDGTDVQDLQVDQERNRRGMRHLKEIIRKPAAMGDTDAHE